MPKAVGSPASKGFLLGSRLLPRLVPFLTFLLTPTAVGDGTITAKDQARFRREAARGGLFGPKGVISAPALKSMSATSGAAQIGKWFDAVRRPSVQVSPRIRVSTPVLDRAYDDFVEALGREAQRIPLSSPRPRKRARIQAKPDPKRVNKPSTKPQPRPRPVQKPVQRPSDPSVATPLAPHPPKAPVARPVRPPRPQPVEDPRFDYRFDEDWYPELVVEGRLEPRPQARVRTRLVKGRIPRREHDRKAQSRSMQNQLYALITRTYGGYTEVGDLWEAFEANLRYKNGDPIPGYITDEGKFRGFVAGYIELDTAGFLRDFVFNQIEDHVIGRLNSRISERLGMADEVLSINQKRNILARGGQLRPPDVIGGF